MSAELIRCAVCGKENFESADRCWACRVPMSTTPIITAEWVTPDSLKKPLENSPTAPQQTIRKVPVFVKVMLYSLGTLAVAVMAIGLLLLAVVFAVIVALAQVCFGPLGS